MNLKRTVFPFVIAIATTLFFSCTNKENKVESFAISGIYVNNTLIKNAAYTALLDVPSFCYEMNFLTADKVLLSYVTACSDTLIYKKEGENYVLLDASSEGNMYFTLNQDSSITLLDTSWTKASIYSQFLKVTENKKTKREAFDYYLNKQMVTGEYIVYKNNVPTNQKIIFSNDGYVTGLKKYNTYYICYMGDCLFETVPTSNTICFNSNDTASIVFTLKTDKKNKRLQLYSLGEVAKDIKGSRPILDMVYDLRQ